jgi:hypothetical protein
MISKANKECKTNMYFITLFILIDFQILICNEYIKSEKKAIKPEFNKQINKNCGNKLEIIK